MESGTRNYISPKLLIFVLLFFVFCFGFIFTKKPTDKLYRISHKESRPLIISIHKLGYDCPIAKEVFTNLDKDYYSIYCRNGKRFKVKKNVFGKWKVSESKRWKK